MNIVSLSCKILSLVLLWLPYLVACDHPGSTKKSKPPDADIKPLYSANANNSNASGLYSKIIYPDETNTESRPRHKYRTREYRGPTSRRVIDYRKINKPKMEIKGEDDFSYSYRYRGGGRHRERRRGTEYWARREYLNSKVLMLLDLNTQNPYGYDVSYDGNKIICRANHPYLFGLVKRGNTTLWSPKTGDYPYKVVCITIDGRERCKVYFPDYENDYPPSKPTRVDVYRRVGGRLGPDLGDPRYYPYTHAHLSPEIQGLRGQFLTPQHIPTPEVNPTPHTTLDAQTDETNLPPVEPLAADETEPIDGQEQTQEGEMASEDVNMVDQGQNFVNVEVPAGIPGENPSETERVNHAEVMADYFNQSYDQGARPYFQPVPGYSMPYCLPRRRHRSSRRYHHHDRSFYDDPYYDDYSYDHHYYDYPPRTYNPRPEPVIPVPPQRTDFMSQISPRDVVVHTEPNRQDTFDINVDRKKKENLVLTFATKSNVYVLDGANHSFALNQNNNDPGTNERGTENNDQESGNNTQQRIVFNGQDPNRLQLDAGTVRISCPTQVIDGVPMPTGLQPVRSNVYTFSPVPRTVPQPSQIPVSPQNLRYSGVPRANPNRNANVPTPSNQRPSQPATQRPSQAATQQPANQRPSQPPAQASAQPVTQQTPTQQGATQPQPQQAAQPVTQQAATQPAAQKATPQAVSQPVSQRPQAVAQPVSQQPQQAATPKAAAQAVNQQASDQQASEHDTSASALDATLLDSPDGE